MSVTIQTLTRHYTTKEKDGQHDILFKIIAEKYQTWKENIFFKKSKTTFPNDNRVMILNKSVSVNPGVETGNSPILLTKAP